MIFDDIRAIASYVQNAAQPHCLPADAAQRIALMIYESYALDAARYRAVRSTMGMPSRATFIDPAEWDRYIDGFVRHRECIRLAAVGRETREGESLSHPPGGVAGPS